MYLKSIEVHGFKSFANKILFEFHDGITAIVGPNGSGKSNVADAVRWVLGEQSAKQLRGSNMQDVIFSGSEVRKPLGYAYVAITFDNSDHKLPIDFTEVSVARRVYRSGESEYLVNGNNCRLRDIQEMFMDTGIGKEGYSIIGQGQIDRILSTKPEERRELFDEAVGIVKFKKRKALAEKNLEEEKQNLARVTDIQAEIEKQIGPLEIQAKNAREYLQLKEQLKLHELNLFLLENEKNEMQKNVLDEKYVIVSDDLNKTKDEYENSKANYERLDTLLEENNKSIEACMTRKSGLLLEIEKKEGEIKVCEQQLLSIGQNIERIEERAAETEKEKKSRENELRSFDRQRAGYDKRLSELGTKQEEASERILRIREKTERLNHAIDEANYNIKRILDENGNIRTNTQKYETMLEQNAVRKTELAQRLLHIRSNESDIAEIIESREKVLKEINDYIENKSSEAERLKDELKNTEGEASKLSDLVNGIQQSYIGEKSRYESMRNMAERYEGYGSTVKKVMEVRDRYQGIEGVVADLISVDRRYETAVETALGASIQHIVTVDEDTAKTVIGYLKENKLGRATFLPMTSVGDGRQKNDESIMKEQGVIGDAASLVVVEEKYQGIINYLLKSFIVLDNIDNALKLARKHNYSLRIVTLEGEQLNPGGSIAGGTFRNSSNLLGRKRELDSLSSKIRQLSEELEVYKAKKQTVSDMKMKLREELEDIRRGLQDKYVERNTAEINLNKERQNLTDIHSRYDGYRIEIEELEKQAAEYKRSIQGFVEGLEANRNRNSELEKIISDSNSELITLRLEEEKASESASLLRVEYANIEQAGQYSADNMERVMNELRRLSDEEESFKHNREISDDEQKRINEQIILNNESIRLITDEVRALDGRLVALTNRKDEAGREHRSFLEKWEELNKRVSELDKELFRLQNQRDRLNEMIDGQISYIWQEYELTISSAEEYRDAKTGSITENRKIIAEIKNSIRELGSVNVNAIEDYKNISERHAFYSAQRDDLIQSEDTIKRLINELDEEMRIQFTTQFKLIREEFNVVFRELFGGGKGELELIEDEDILDAGIRIIAQPPGKRLQNMMQLSGGEKALTAIALLFAIQNLKPSPFCLLDEIEAALDDSNVKRYAKYLQKLTKNSQFIVITHRRGTMAVADILYGITMQEKGVSTLVSVNLIESELK